MIPKEDFLCSFDIRNFFTNVSFAETIQICEDALHGGEVTLPYYPKEILVQLKNAATKSAEFSFNNN